MTGCNGICPLSEHSSFFLDSIFWTGISLPESININKISYLGFFHNWLIYTYKFKSNTTYIYIHTYMFDVQKTNYINVTKFNHVEPTYAFELSKFN